MESEALFHVDLFLKFTVALLALLNPLLAIPLFLQLTKDFTEAERRRTAHIVAITVFVASNIVLAAGEEFLAFFGISVPGFQIAGGIFILLLGLSILNSSGETDAAEPDGNAPATKRSIAVVPLAIPILFGPGVITTIIVFTQFINDLNEVVSMEPAVAIICVLIWLGLLFAAPIERVLGDSTMHVITRIMGLLLTAIAVEMVIAGIVHVTKTNFFPEMLSGAT